MLPSKHSSTYAVGEAYAHVQGESLKAYAALLIEAYQLPDHQGEGSRSMKLPSMLLAAFLLTGCVSAGVRVDEANLHSFEKGKTTYSEIVARLGPPTTNSLLPDGRRMLMYSYVQATARPENFIPLVGAFVGGADSRSSNVILWIDQEGKLASFSTSESQYGVGRGLEAGPTDGRVPNQPRVSAPAPQ